MDGSITLGQVIVPGLSAILGGIAAGVGAYYAMRIELAILRTRVEQLAQADDDHAANINDAHRRIDRMLESRRASP